VSRLVSPDRGCIEADVAGRRYRGRILEVENPAHVAALREVGYFDASTGGVPTGKTFVCPVGHHNFLPTCGRCAADSAA